MRISSRKSCPLTANVHASSHSGLPPSDTVRVRSMRPARRHVAYNSGLRSGVLRTLVRVASGTVRALRMRMRRSPTKEFGESNRQSSPRSHDVVEGSRDSATSSEASPVSSNNGCRLIVLLPSPTSSLSSIALSRAAPKCSSAVKACGEPGRGGHRAECLTEHSDVALRRAWVTGDSPSTVEHVGPVVSSEICGRAESSS
mmetsp:Transcript_5538/g.8632  ORF Transcript_5538/g.8632 Transcript_5538/m.8632 type:complete len:200 (-) Transcript_5538:767-1366(-)